MSAPDGNQDGGADLDDATARIAQAAGEQAAGGSWPTVLAEVLLAAGDANLESPEQVRALDDTVILRSLAAAVDLARDVAAVVGREGALVPDNGPVIIEALEQILRMARTAARLEERLTAAERRLADYGAPVAVAASSARDVFDLLLEVLPDGGPGVDRTSRDWTVYASRVDSARQVARWARDGQEGSGGTDG